MPLEDALRSSLGRAAQGGPAPSGDLSSLVLARARRIRRLRYTAGAVSLVVVLVLAIVVTGGLAGLVGRSPDRTLVVLPVPRPSTVDHVRPAPQQLDLPTVELALHASPVDVIANGVLYSADGAQVDVSVAGTAVAAYRAIGGWLVLGERGDLWYAHADGSLDRLLPRTASYVTVDNDGSRVAWRQGDTLRTAPVTPTGLGPQKRTGVPANVRPTGFAAQRVLLVRGATTALPRAAADRAEPVPTDVELGAWAPALGAYQQRALEVLWVYGPRADGALVGQVAGPGGRRCLARLDATTLHATGTACGLSLTERAAGWLSPGGQWLVVESGGQAVAIDLDTAFTGAPRAVPLGAPPPAGTVAWEDGSTLVRAVGRDGLRRLRLDRLAAGSPGGVEDIARPDDAPSTPLVVVAGG